MDDKLIAAIIGGLAGILTGLVSSFLAPWANWGIEKRRQKLMHRKELVKSWRAMIANQISNPETGKWNKRALLERPEYMSLRPHLSSEAEDRIKLGLKSHEDGSGPIMPALLEIMIEEIDRIEQEWDLV